MGHLSLILNPFWQIPYLIASAQFTQMNLSIQKCLIPVKALLEKYACEGSYADCYWTEIPGRISLSEYIQAFYSTSLFKLERLILELAVAKPSTDIQAGQLARGQRDQFAAWHVEARTNEQILMCDFHGRTRSWLMVDPIEVNNYSRTRLYFGSAVVPVRNANTGELQLGTVYKALLGFHRIYSILLLYSARWKLKGQHSRTR